MNYTLLVLACTVCILPASCLDCKTCMEYETDNADLDKMVNTASVMCATAGKTACAEGMSKCMTAKLTTKMTVLSESYNIDMYMGMCSMDAVTCDLIQQSIPTMDSESLKIEFTGCKLDVALPGSGVSGLTSSLLMIAAIVVYYC